MYTATYLYSALLHRSAGPSGLKKTKTSQNGLVKKSTRWEVPCSKLWKHERKSRAVEVSLEIFHCVEAGEGKTACKLMWAHLKQHDCVNEENSTWLSRREAKTQLQVWWSLVLSVWFSSECSYLMCMFGKCLCTGHHARGPFIQLSQFLSSLIKSNTSASQVPDDSSCSSSHTFNSTWSRDVLGETARGFSCRGLTNCKGEIQTGGSERLRSSMPPYCNGTCGGFCSLFFHICNAAIPPALLFVKGSCCHEGITDRSQIGQLRSLPFLHTVLFFSFLSLK